MTLQCLLYSKFWRGHCCFSALNVYRMGRAVKMWREGDLGWSWGAGDFAWSHWNPPYTWQIQTVQISGHLPWPTMFHCHRSSEMQFKTPLFCFWIWMVWLPGSLQNMVLLYSTLQDHRKRKGQKKKKKVKTNKKRAADLERRIRFSHNGRREKLKKKCICLVGDFRFL